MSWYGSNARGKVYGLFVVKALELGAHNIAAEAVAKIVDEYS